MEVTIMLTPLDIQNQEFRRSFRGYNEDEVEEFMEKISKDYEKLYQDTLDYKESIERLSSKLEHYQQIEQTLHNTLVIAQETAEDVKLNAKKETELRIREAEVKSQQLVDEAMLKVRRMNGEYEDIQKQAQIFRVRMRTLLKAQMEMLDKTEEDEV